MYWLCIRFPSVFTGDVFISHGPKPQRVRAGSRVAFHCIAATDNLLQGIPQITWKKDNVKINVGVHHPSGDRRDSAENQLVLYPTSTQDTGLYTCIASLDQDIDTASARLIVEGLY